MGSSSLKPHEIDGVGWLDPDLHREGGATLAVICSRTRFILASRSSEERPVFLDSTWSNEIPCSYPRVS
ncbi:hypothetical protein IAQ61_011688 [Plenodomus lingam]|uniref:uncharacterized protein n=1 Tax=Leptosphaeria maculans TaxID=5022 RepID=UPI0033175114|nr:hypothetical protein IAQ61_011688 [Plenodomus lingam]